MLQIARDYGVHLCLTIHLPLLNGTFDSIVNRVTSSIKTVMDPLPACWKRGDRGSPGMRWIWGFELALLLLLQAGQEKMRLDVALIIKDRLLLERERFHSKGEVIDRKGA
jgi:hypothetical protein